MNPKQNALYQVNCAIVSVKDIDSLMKMSEVAYGFINYVAKYSLANDKYYTTDYCLSHLKENNFIREAALLRGKKSQKNGFTYEHPVPANVIARRIIQDRKDPEAIKRILESTDRIVVLTSEENERIPKKLISAMPGGWEFFKNNVFARYFESGILRNETDLHVIDVYGSVKR